MTQKRAKKPPSEAALDKDAHGIHSAMVELVRVYQLRDRQRVCYHDISATQCYALGVLLAGGPMALNALAGALFLDKSTTSRAVDSLEQKNYVTRSADPDDARALKIAITAKGRRLHSRILDDLYQQTRELTATYERRERLAIQEFIEGFTSMAAARFRGEKG